MRFLRWYCSEAYTTEIEGDLAELFDEWYALHGLRAARWRYILHVLLFVRLYNCRFLDSRSSQPYVPMISHNLKVIQRSFVKNKTFSLINMLGLAMGLGGSLLILLWVMDEYAVDRFHENTDQLYVVNTRSYHQGNVGGGPGTPYYLGKEMTAAFPEVQAATGWAPWLGAEPETFSVDDKTYKMAGNRARPEFFSMFSFPLLEGDPATALAAPNSIAISRQMAEVFFGSPEAALGQVLRHDNRQDVTVQAVFENVPAQSTLQFDFLMHWDAWVEEDPIRQLPDAFHVRTVIQLDEQADPDLVEAKITDFLDTYIGFNEEEFDVELTLQPFAEQYLVSGFEDGVPSGGRIVYVRLFGSIALFILLIACINFMNLSTASYQNRAKEVAVRKVTGASRWELISYFVTEAAVFACLGIGVALGLVWLMLPLFNDLTGKALVLPFSDPVFVSVLGSLLVMTGLLAGSYPALILSNIRPIKALKGTFRFGVSATRFRRTLVVVQFSISIMLIVSTLVISNQVQYFQSKNLGFEREHLVYMPLEGELIPDYLVFKERLKDMPGIKMVDRSSQAPHAMTFNTGAMHWEGKDPETLVFGFTPTSVGYDFVDIMGLEIVQGRDFSAEFASDANNFIVNERAVEIMGFEDPIGKQVGIFGKSGEIVGVVKDYHFNSMHNAILPMAIDIKEDLHFGTILIRTEAGKLNEALASMEDVAQAVNPAMPFAYSFSDQEYEQMYRNEQVMMRLSHAFAFMAIFISCLGLLGLAAFSVEQRVKEVGIRKVLGASVSSIVALFSKEFVMLVGLAIGVAVPLSYVLMDQWLNRYAYAIDLTWMFFAVAAAAALGITLLTVSAQALKAAFKNPVDSLRTE